MKAYKIVHKFNEKLYSSGYLFSLETLNERLKNGNIIEYKIGEAVSPHTDCGPLCLFDTLEYAKEYCGGFIEGVHNIEIYICDYTKSEEIKMWTINRSSKLISEAIYSYFANRIVLADSVTLLSKV